MTPDDAILLDAARCVANRLNRMSAALEDRGDAGECNTVAAGLLLAFGSAIDAVCDEVEARDAPPDETTERRADA